MTCPCGSSETSTLPVQREPYGPRLMPARVFCAHCGLYLNPIEESETAQ